MLIRPIGLSGAYGAGAWGAEGGISYNPSTEIWKLEYNVEIEGQGVAQEISLRFDQNGHLKIEEMSGFVGANVTLGA